MQSQPYFWNNSTGSNFLRELQQKPAGQQTTEGFSFSHLLLLVLLSQRPDCGERVTHTPEFGASRGIPIRQTRGWTTAPRPVPKGAHAFLTCGHDPKSIQTLAPRFLLKQDNLLFPLMLTP